MHGACKTLFLESNRFGEIRRIHRASSVCMRCAYSWIASMLLHRFKCSMLRLSRVNACEHLLICVLRVCKAVGRYMQKMHQHHAATAAAAAAALKWLLGDVVSWCFGLSVFHTRFSAIFVFVFVLPLMLIYANSRRIQTAVLRSTLRQPRGPFLWRRI